MSVDLDELLPRGSDTDAILAFFELPVRWPGLEWGPSERGGGVDGYLRVPGDGRPDSLLWRVEILVGGDRVGMTVRTWRGDTFGLPPTRWAFWQLIGSLRTQVLLDIEAAERDIARIRQCLPPAVPIEFPLLNSKITF